MIDIKQGNPIPGQFQFFALLLIIAGVGFGIIYTNIIAGIILVLIGFVILTTQTGIMFNISDNTYQEYTIILFFKIGDIKPLGNIDKIYINKTKISQRIYTAHTASSKDFKNVQYAAYALLGSDEKLFLLSNRKKDIVMNKIKALVSASNVQITDNTT